MFKNEVYPLSYKLRYARENNGFTQSFVAEKINKSRSAYSYYESGKAEPNLETLKILSKLFNVSLSYFLSNEPFEKCMLDSHKKEQSENHSVSMADLINEEKELIAHFRLATSKEKRKILASLNNDKSRS